MHKKENMNAVGDNLHDNLVLLVPQIHDLPKYAQKIVNQITKTPVHPTYFYHGNHWWGIFSFPVKDGYQNLLCLRDTGSGISYFCADGRDKLGLNSLNSLYHQNKNGGGDCWKPNFYGSAQFFFRSEDSGNVNAHNVNIVGNFATKNWLELYYDEVGKVTINPTRLQVMTAIKLGYGTKVLIGGVALASMFFAGLKVPDRLRSRL